MFKSIASRPAGRVLAAALAATSLALAAAPAQATKIEKVTSPAGIEIWLVRDATVPLIALNFAFRGGSSQDPADKSGTANLVMDTLDEGAGALDSTAYHDRLERKAIELSFQVSRDYVRGSLRTLKDNQSDAFELLRLALNEPHFNAPDVDRVRAQTISRLERESVSPNSIASRNWWETAFPNHPYGRLSTGTLESVPKITPDDLKAFRQRNFARDNLKVAIVGDIDAAGAGRLIDAAFASLPAKANLRLVPNASMQGLGRQQVIDLDVPQAVVTFGGPGVKRDDPDFMAAYVVNHILGGGSFSSRLYREVREKRGLAYGVSASLVWLEHAAVLVGGTATRADATGQAIDVIKDQFRLMAESGPTEQEVKDAKTFLVGSYALALDTSTKIASQLVNIQLDDLGIDYVDKRSAMIDAVTLADTKRVAKRLLDPGLLVTVVGRPQGVTSKGAAD
jgi:zinc protease